MYRVTHQGTCSIQKEKGGYKGPENKMMCLSFVEVIELE